MRIQHLNVLFNVVNSIFLGLIFYTFTKPVLTKTFGAPSISEDLPFAWSRYEDPESIEFWDNGFYNGVPSRPMRYVAKYPTQENFSLLAKWQAKRHRLAIMNGFGLAQAQQKSVKSGDSETGNDIKFDFNGGKSSDFIVNWSEVELVYIYSSECSGCKANKGLVEELLKSGVKTTFLQLGKGAPLHPGSVPYDAEYKQFFPITVTPTYYINLGKNKVFTTTGAMSMEQLKENIHTFLSRKDGNNE